MKVSILTIFTERLALLSGFVATAAPEQSEYQRGYLDCLRWAIGQAEGHERGEHDGHTLGGDPLDAIREGALLTMPPRSASLPCTPGRTHAYNPNTPRHGTKQCRHCGQMLKMEHGELIAAGRSARRPSRQRTPAPLELVAV